MTWARPATGWAAGLDDGAWQALAVRGRHRKMARGSTLFAQGERTGAVAILVDGRLKIARVTDDGTEALLAVRGPGDLVGELAALDGRPRSASVTALEPASLLVVEAGVFRSWLRAYPDVALRLLAVLAGRLRDADIVRAEFPATDVTARLARRLLQLAAQYGEPDGDTVRIDLPVTQDDLAGWVGASREAVAKGMRRLRDAGAVTTARRQVAVRDVAALRRLAR